MTKRSLRFVDYGDWFDAALYIVFLIILPIVVILIWLNVPEVAPVWAAAALTVASFVCIPFLLREVVRAGTRILIIYPGENHLQATIKTPFSASHEVWQFTDIDAIVVRRSTSSEGDFHSGAVCLKDGREFVFVQRNHEAGVRERAEELRSALRTAGLGSVEIVEGR